MWHNLKLEQLSGIEKTVAEFTVWMVGVVPYAKMKVKIYESQNVSYTGRTDLKIKRKSDGKPENAIGTGKTIDEALEDTINYFNSMLKEDVLNELTEDDIEYAEYPDF